MFTIENLIRIKRFEYKIQIQIEERIHFKMI